MIVMKKFYLVVVCVLFVNHLFAKIKNGYESQLEDSRSSLQALNLLLLEDKKMSPVARLQFKSKMDYLVDYISFYELTEEFIRQFKILAPVMFTETRQYKGQERKIDRYLYQVSSTGRIQNSP